MKIVPGIILNFLILFGASAYAAPSGPPPPGVPPPGLPIDGGVVLLFVIALGYGIYKINQLKINKKTPM
ncbi:PID-CTERM protein-sorting domain-containing protein [Flavobacterium sp.]|uniref:PID-CTERM protein-sorting domain-containing protein n=1 Tax=Flavobacterium sp. TaxID=239 RepID=UPI00286D1EDD|nr:hypothetical protein [Flavobacterium sp.]